MTPEQIWAEMQTRLPFHDDMAYEPMGLDEFTFSQCSMQLARRHTLATDSTPDSEERIDEWRGYIEEVVGTWWKIHYPKVQGTRWESNCMVLLGEMHEAWGEDTKAESYYGRAVKCGHRGDGGGAYKALQNLVGLGHEDPFAAGL